MVEWLKRFVPDHGFHPVVIHFPIALFLFGGLLDVIGWRRRNEVIRQAGSWNMLAGVWSSLVVIPTGIVAFLLSDYTLQGTVILHMISAGGAVLLMTAAVLRRRKEAVVRTTYLVLLTLAMAALALAGYFGGELVYSL